MYAIAAVYLAVKSVCGQFSINIRAVVKAMYFLLMNTSLEDVSPETEQVSRGLQFLAALASMYDKMDTGSKVQPTATLGHRTLA